MISTVFRRRSHVAVNISGRVLSSANFADSVIAVLEQLDVTSEPLILEVTVSALLTDPPRTGGDIRGTRRPSSAGEH